MSGRQVVSRKQNGTKEGVSRVTALDGWPLTRPAASGPEGHTGSS